MNEDYNPYGLPEDDDDMKHKISYEQGIASENCEVCGGMMTRYELSYQGCCSDCYIRIDRELRGGELE